MNDEPKPDNPPAFPNYTGNDGLTFLDYFAGQVSVSFKLDDRCTFEDFAIMAYDQAEAMLKERAKRMAKP